MRGGAIRPGALLVSPVFFGSIALLLLNDHVLKAAWPGLVTGKLSDVAGVVIPGGSTLAQPSSSELAALAGTVRESGVDAIFANVASSTVLVDALAQEIGREIAVVPLYVGSVGAHLLLQQQGLRHLLQR